jgi:hypothetical protein
MADPDWSDSERDDLFSDIGFPLALASKARTEAMWCHPQSAEFLVAHSDENAHTYFTAWDITACKQGTDTSADGWIYWKYTDGGASGTLEAYNDSARSVLVATTGSVANSTSMTLTPETGYTLAGTVMHGAPGASFNWRSQILTPAHKRLEHLFDNTQVDDPQIRAFLSGVLTRMYAAYQQAEAAANEGWAFVMRTKLRRMLAGGVSDPNQIILDTIKRSSFAWTQETRGLAYDLEKACEDNTGGSGAIEVQGSTLAGAVSYPGSWDGAAVTPTYGQRGVPCVIVGQCTQTLSTSPPQFTLTRTFTDTRRAPGLGTQSETLSRPLYMGSAWKAPEWGIESLTIDYLASVSNVTSALLSTTATDWSVTGLRSTNSNAGVLYATYVTSDTTLRFYKTSAGRDALSADELVAQVTIAAASTATTFTTDENDSGIVISGKTGAGSGGVLVNLSDGDVNFNIPTATNPASYFQVTVTETTAGGEWVRAFREFVKWQPNTGAGLDVTDGPILRGVPGIHQGVYGDRY